MQVTKINITTEKIDIPKNKIRIRFSKVDNISEKWREEEVLCASLNRNKEETWEVQRLIISGEKEKFYLVKVDKRDLFTDLLKITDHKLADKIIVALNNFKRKELPEYLEKEIESIKNLSWWKRLFKKF